jgi:hypothetical protein
MKGVYSGWPACKKEKMGAALVGFCERELLRLPARGESEGAERGLSFFQGKGADRFSGGNEKIKEDRGGGCLLFFKG